MIHTWNITYIFFSRIVITISWLERVFFIIFINPINLQSCQFFVISYCRFKLISSNMTTQSFDVIVSDLMENWLKQFKFFDYFFYRRYSWENNTFLSKIFVNWWALAINWQCCFSSIDVLNFICIFNKHLENCGACYRIIMIQSSLRMQFWFYMSEKYWVLSSKRYSTL